MKRVKYLALLALSDFKNLLKDNFKQELSPPEIGHIFAKTKILNWSEDLSCSLFQFCHIFAGVLYFQSYIVAAMSAVHFVCK